MYSHWQASWRSAAIVGMLVLAYFSIALVLGSPAGLKPTSKFWLMQNEVVTVGVRVLIVAVAVRCGLYVSGIKKAGLMAVGAISASYLLFSTLISSLPLPTRTVTLELQNPSESSGVGALLIFDISVLKVLVVPFLLAFFASFCVARFIRARDSVA